MNNRSILTGFVSIITLSILFWYSLVFAWAWFFDSKPINTTLLFKLSNNIYLDSLDLSKNKILFRSWEDLSDYKISSSCNIFSKLIYSKWNYYMFDLKFFDNKCNSEEFILINSKDEIKSKFNLKLVTKYSILDKMLDFKTDYLVKLKNILEEKKSKYSKYEIYDRKIESNYYLYLEKNRILNETEYNLNIINNIINGRNEKYIVPLLWRKLPTKIVKVPNSGRWYRENYTDGIHHGWDIDWEFWEQIVSLDDWIVIRVVSEFDFSDLSKIKKWNNLSDYDKTRNLDILRWKQVWIKTIKWDVVMYSHLNEVFSNIEAGEVVYKKQPIWTLWITWVPDKSYKDFHVHFPIHINPFNLWKNNYYDLDDYMQWDWLFKWKTWEYILENQNDIFEN